MLAPQIDRLRRERNQSDLAGLAPPLKFEIANRSFFFQNRQGALTIVSIYIEAELDRALSNEFSATVTGQRDEGIVDFHDGAIGNTANDETVGAGLECFGKSFLAFAQGFVRQLTLCDVDERGD